MIKYVRVRFPGALCYFYPSKSMLIRYTRAVPTEWDIPLPPSLREPNGRVMTLPYGWTVRVLKITLSLRDDRRSPWQSPVGFGTLPQSEIRDFRQPPQRGGRERVRIVGVGVLDDPLATVQILPAGRPEAGPYERDCHCASAHTLAPSNEGAVSFR